MADFARSPAGTRAVNGKIRKSWQLPTSCQPGLPSSKAACTKYLRVIGRVHIQYIMYNQYIMYMVWRTNRQTNCNTSPAPASAGKVITVKISVGFFRFPSNSKEFKKWEHLSRLNSLTDTNVIAIVNKKLVNCTVSFDKWASAT